MHKVALCSVLSALILSGCAGTSRTRITGIARVVMRDADAFVLVVADPATGELYPRKFFAEHVTIVPDVPFGASAWAEYVDRPGEMRGEGDTLILHVRSLTDVE